MQTIDDLDQRKAAVALLVAANAADAKLAEAEDAADEAWEAYNEHPSALWVVDGTNEPIFCAKTGVPLLITDEVDYVLRSPAKAEAA